MLKICPYSVFLTKMDLWGKHLLTLVFFCRSTCSSQNMNNQEDVLTQKVISEDMNSVYQVLTEGGQPCVFPFRYGGKLHYSCISNKVSRQHWCATTANYDRDHKKGHCIIDPVISVSEIDPCLQNPCQNGGTCAYGNNEQTYFCLCTELFMGRNCEKEKCFDESRYKYFDIGETWGRIWQMNVEQCTCNEKGIACSRIKFTGCLENVCSNNGTCRQIYSTKEKVCSCRGNYAGHHCNINLTHNCFDYDNNGTEYRGIVNKTVSGTDCIHWNSEILHEEFHIHSLADAEKLGLGEHNFCRNPDADHQPWCYTMKENHLAWDYCAIPYCGRLTGRMVPSPKHPSLANCGKRHQKRKNKSRILGGISSLPGSHPWLAAIYIGKDFCAGSLIRPCWVLSAAHCFANSPLKSMIKVVLGQYLFNDTSSDTQSFEVEKYIFHDRFSAFNPTEYDIVLIRLKKKNEKCVVASQFIRTVCLPSSDMTFPEGQMCEIAGWGHQTEGEREYSDVLLETKVPLISFSKCSSPEVYGTEISLNMMCAGYFDSSADACQGDSGGPLICVKNNTAYIYGIISWGDGCGRKNKPGVYTQVTKYIDWISSKV
ncbi:hepatocyte growth factor activator [Protopterus annectens]|uniref:hepatocyte growth factor activator n=1 Tax=Protopterus annectens TaxID=7888 RepID=UPI001CFA9D16|nr:hepatocyte growth factor activator [Protopterus annectens]